MPLIEENDMSVTLRQLRVFDAVSTLGSVSKGALALGLSQSSASVALAEMQARLGKTLFIRSHGQAARLTAEGLRMQPLVRSILKDVSELSDAEEPRLLEGRLTIGAAASIGDYILPQLCAAFRRKHPAVTLEIIVAGDGELIRALEHMDLETALIENSTSLAQIEMTPWCMDELWIVAHPGHPLADKDNIMVHDLAGAQWCLRERTSSISIRLKLELQDRLGRLPTALEINSNAGLIEAASTGIGIACLSRTIVEPAIAAGRLSRIAPADFAFSRQLHLARPKGLRRNRLTASFDAFILDASTGQNDEADERRPWPAWQRLA